MQNNLKKNEKTSLFRNSPLQNEEGFLLVITMLILVVLTLIGISATNLSRIELQIAGNDRLHKETFYRADGGTEVGAHLLEENIACPVGFSGSLPKTIDSVQILTDLRFWANETAPADPYPDDAVGKRYIRYNADFTTPPIDTVPHTNIHFFGNSSLTTGNAIQMLAGYEGVGYGAATGGGQLVTNVDSQHRGVNNSLSSIRLNWRHIIGQEGVCQY